MIIELTLYQENSDICLKNSRILNLYLKNSAFITTTANNLGQGLKILDSLFEDIFQSEGSLFPIISVQNTNFPVLIFNSTFRKILACKKLINNK